MVSLKILHSESRQPDLSIVVPVYRSEGCLVALYDAITEALALIACRYELIFVNDCSPDGSWKVVEYLCMSDPKVVGVDLRRNFGQDNAILTGLRNAMGKYIAIMDDDLQHHPRYLPALLAKLEEGADVVYADFGSKRQKVWKNIGSWINGKIAEWVIDKPKGIYLSPYKVVRREVAELICGYTGPSPYIDGLLFQCTSRIAQVPVEHFSRFEGQSNYTFLRSLGVSARLAFSFSGKPLRVVSWCGILFATLGLLLMIGVIGYRLLFPQAFTAEAVGWASLIVAILLTSGIQMIFFGALGEYTGRTFLLVSGKPQTAIRQILREGIEGHSMYGLGKQIYEEVKLGHESNL
jgi:undecaprenyl-phosphate 4-deoxy-4-formamido-L-arabinose transferase